MRPGWGRLFTHVTAVAAAAVVAGCAGTAAPATTSLTASASQQTGIAAPGTSGPGTSGPGTSATASSSAASRQQSAGQQASDSGLRTTAPKPATSAPPTTVRSAAAPATVTSAPAPLTRACTAADLALTGADEVRSQDGSVGDWVARFSLRNTSRSGCRLNGWPGLVFFGEDVIAVCVPPGGFGPTCPPPPDHTTPQPISVTRADSPREVLLASGATTVFAVLWTVGNFCQSDKPILDPYGVHVLVPGDSQPLTLLFDNLNHMQICGEEVQVTAFGAAG